MMMKTTVVFAVQQMTVSSRRRGGVEPDNDVAIWRAPDSGTATCAWPGGRHQQSSITHINSNRFIAVAAVAASAVLLLPHPPPPPRALAAPPPSTPSPNCCRHYAQHRPKRPSLRRRGSRPGSSPFLCSRRRRPTRQHSPSAPAASRPTRLTQ